MGLLGLLRKVRIKQKRFKIAVFGFDCTGKTSIIKAMTKNEKEQPPPAHEGFQINPLTLDDFTLHFWEIGGAPSDRPFWPNYLDSTDSLLFVFDASDKRRLDQVQAEFAKLTSTLETKCPGCSILVVCTNAGPGNLRKGEIVRALKLKELKPRVGCVACKPDNEDSVQDVLRWICDDIVRRYFPE